MRPHPRRQRQRGDTHPLTGHTWRRNGLEDRLHGAPERRTHGRRRRRRSIHAYPHDHSAHQYDHPDLEPLPEPLLLPLVLLLPIRDPLLSAEQPLGKPLLALDELLLPTSEAVGEALLELLLPAEQPLGQPLLVPDELLLPLLGELLVPDELLLLPLLGELLEPLLPAEQPLRQPLLVPDELPLPLLGELLSKSLPTDQPIDLHLHRRLQRCRHLLCGRGS